MHPFIKTTIYHLCFLFLLGSLGSAQTQTSYNEARALIETEYNTISVVTLYGGSVVAVNVLQTQPETLSPQPVVGGVTQTVKHSGSGFYVQLSGQPYIITNYHVVRGAQVLPGQEDVIEVTFFDNYQPRAHVAVRVKHILPEWDLAVLEPINPERVPAVLPLPLGDSSSLQVGQKVIAIGSPFGLNTSVTTGIVSALNRQLFEGFPPMIQTDASINRGSSGGPLLNSRGEVVGVTSAVYNPAGESFVGVGLAVPTRPLLNALHGLGLEPTDSPNVDTRSTFGASVMSVQKLPKSVRLLYGLPDEGLLVLSVAVGSPADEAGLQASIHPVTYGAATLLVGGDVIVAVDGESVLTPEHLYNVARSVNADPKYVTVVRSGQRDLVRMSLGR